MEALNGQRKDPNVTSSLLLRMAPLLGALISAQAVAGPLEDAGQEAAAQEATGRHAAAEEGAAPSAPARRDEWQYLTRHFTADGFEAGATAGAPAAGSRAIIRPASGGLQRTGGFDGSGNSYAAGFLPRGERLTVTSSRFGPVELVRPSDEGGDNNLVPCEGQEIRVGTRRIFNVLLTLGAAHDGAHFGWIEFTFDDGTTGRGPFGFSDWHGDPILGEETAFRLPVVGPAGQPPGGGARLFLQRTPVPAEKRIVAIRLPNAPQAKILAMTLGWREGVRPMPPPAKTSPEPGVVAIFGERCFPHYLVRGDLTPARIEEAFDRSGIEASVLDLEGLEDPAILHPRSYPVLVNPYGNAFPEEAEETIRAFRKAGGIMVHLGIPFTHPVVRTPYGTWIDRGHREEHMLHDGERALGSGRFLNAGRTEIIAHPVLDGWGLAGVRWDRFLLPPEAVPPHEDFLVQVLRRESLHPEDEVVPLLGLRGFDADPVAAVVRHGSCPFAGATDLWLGPIFGGLLHLETPVDLAAQLMVRGVAAILAERGLIDEETRARAHEPLPEALREPERIEAAMPPPGARGRLPAAAPTGGRVVRVGVVSVAGLDDAERVLLATAQGLVNRRLGNGPGADLAVCLSEGPETDAWLRWYTERGLVDEVVPLEPRRLIEMAGTRAAVIPDRDLRGSLNLALAVAAAEGTLVAYPELIARHGLEPAVDLRGVFGSQAECIAWAIENVLPRLETPALALVEPDPRGWRSHDAIVAMGAFPFWVSWGADASLRGASRPEEMAAASRLLVRTPVATPVLAASSGAGGPEALSLLSWFGKHRVRVDGLANLSLASRLGGPAATGDRPPDGTELPSAHGAEEAAASAPPSDAALPVETGKCHVACVAPDYLRLSAVAGLSAAGLSAAGLSPVGEASPSPRDARTLRLCGWALPVAAFDLFPARAAALARELRAGGALGSTGLGEVDAHLLGGAFGEGADRVKEAYWRLVDRSLSELGAEFLIVDGWRRPRGEELAAAARSVPTARAILAGFRGNVPLDALEASYVLEGKPVLHALAPTLDALRPETARIGAVPPGHAVFLWTHADPAEIAGLPPSPDVVLASPRRLAETVKTYHERVAPVPASLVAAGSTWKYEDSGQDLGKGWRALDHDDSAWKSGPAELGYGDDGEGRPEKTVVSFGADPQNKHPTTYFRRAFEVADPSEILSLSLAVTRDDGCVVYVNGHEVARSNMPEGEPSFGTYASGAVSGDAEHAWQPFYVKPSALRAGRNVIAVEVHQSSGSSSDLSFDLELAGTTRRTP